MDGLNICRDGAENPSCCMRIVVAQREALEMVICAHAQIVCHPLADTLRDVVVDVTGDCADNGNQKKGQRHEGSEIHLLRAGQGRFDPRKHWAGMAASGYIINDDFQRPWCCKVSNRFDDHGSQDGYEMKPIGLQQLTDECP